MSRDKQMFPKKDIDIFGYESPVKIVTGQMRIEQENNIYRAIQEYGVDVDKDELVKALQYDRNQYEKGYVNGYNRRASEVALEVIAEIENLLDENEVVIHRGTYYYSSLKHGIETFKKKYTEVN